jgi:hypothetical protein
VRLSRETWIGVGAFAVATAAMAIDHLIGNDPERADPFPVDPAAFLISVGLAAILALFLFGRVVPRAKARDADPDRTAVNAAIFSGLALVPGFALLWLGFPFVLAGSGIALGLLGRRSRRRRIATAAVVVGAIVVVLGFAAYVATLVRDR